VRGVAQVVGIAVDAVRRAGLEEQDGAGGILTQAAREDAARRPAAHDDHVEHGRIVVSGAVRRHRRIPVITDHPAADHDPRMVVDVPERSRLEILVGDETAGFIEYRRAPGRIAFIHTSIDPRFDGQGLGSELVRTALANARTEGLAVLPFCPFVRSYIAAHPEHLDLVPADMRARFALPAHG